MKLLLSALILFSFSAFAETHDSCAVVYNSLDNNYTSQLELKSGDRIKNLNRLRLETGGDWDNKISAVSVRLGCSLIVHQYQNFNVDNRTGETLSGFTRVFENRNERGYNYVVLDSHLDEKISSLKCYCPHH